MSSGNDAAPNQPNRPQGTTDMESTIKSQHAAANETLAASGFGPLDHMGAQYDDEGERYETYASYPETGEYGVWGSFEHGWFVVHAADGIGVDDFAKGVSLEDALAKATA